MKRIPDDFERTASRFKSLFFIHIPKAAGKYVFQLALRRNMTVLWPGVFYPRPPRGNALRATITWLRRSVQTVLRRCAGRAVLPFWNLVRRNVYMIPHPVCTARPLDIGAFDRAWSDTCIHNRHFKRSLVFSVVRNPFDLLVSMYTYGFPYSRDADPPTFGSFEEFARAYCDPEYPWIVKHQQKYMFFQLFGDDGTCRAHYILRSEELDEGLRVLCKPFGITPRTSNVRVNASRDDSRRDHRRFYDGELRELVEKKCRRELQAFGYTFDGHDERLILGTDGLRYNPHTDGFF